MIQHLNYQGHHIGGLTGFLKSIGFAINHIKPTRVILCFEGAGSTTNKKYLYPEYKANRKLIKVTHWETFDNKEDESESIQNQVVRLIDYLQQLPVNLVAIDKVEADDVIGYLSTHLPNEVVIMSADKDFLQLVSPKVSVYSPIKKKFYTPALVSEEYKVSPANFLNYKILTGDDSDNLPGVKGIGEKKLLKLFPEFVNEQKYSFDYMMEQAEQNIDKHALYGNILNFRRQLDINRQLMDLSNPVLGEEAVAELEELISGSPYKFDRTNFLRMYNEDFLGNSISNVEFWLSNTFSYLTSYK
jgi:5'-3' exonuclease